MIRSNKLFAGSNRKTKIVDKTLHINRIGLKNDGAKGLWDVISSKLQSAMTLLNRFCIV